MAAQRDSLTPQQSPNPLVTHRGQKPLPPAVFGQLRDRPLRIRQSPLSRIGPGDLDQSAQLLGFEDRRAALRIRHPLERPEPTLVEPPDPVVRHREVAPDPVRRVERRPSSMHFIDDTIPLVDPSAQREVLELPTQYLALGTRQASELHTSGHGTTSSAKCG